MTRYIERTEFASAFQVDFQEDDQVYDILEAFGATEDTWTIRCNKGNWTLSFSRPNKTKPEVKSGDWNATITVVVVADADIVARETDWIVTRYTNTDHPETVVMSDKDFQRKYQEDTIGLWALKT